MDITRFEAKVEHSNPFLICDNYIKRPESIYTLGGGWKDRVDKTLRSMFEFVTALENNEEPDEFSFGPVEEILNLFIQTMAELKKTEGYMEFVKAFIFIAYNINENTDGHKVVRKKIEKIQRYCDNSMTFAETLNLSNRVASRLGNWRKWLPPSFRLSGHYYGLIKGE